MNYMVALVDHAWDEFATVCARLLLRAIEHQVEEVLALVRQQSLLNPGANNGRLVSLSDKIDVVLAESEDGRHVVAYVLEARIFVVVRQEVKHDLMTYFHCDLEHSVQVLVIVRVILVLFHREFGWDVLEDKLDQEEELSVEDLTIDHELDVVFCDFFLDPVRNVLLNIVVVDLPHLFLLVSLTLGFSLNHFSDGLF